MQPSHSLPSAYTAQQLAWQHFRLHWWAGLVLNMPIVAVMVLIWRPDMAFVKAAGLGIASTMALGPLAALVGLLRVPLWRWFFGLARHWRQEPALIGRLMWGTANVFLLPVIMLFVLVVAMSDMREPAQIVQLGLIVFGLSLPWLLSSLWATWVMRVSLGQPGLKA